MLLTIHYLTEAGPGRRLGDDDVARGLEGGYRARDHGRGDQD